MEVMGIKLFLNAYRLDSKMHRNKIGLILILLIICSVLFVGSALPEPQGYLNDFAGVLSNEAAGEVEDALLDLKDNLGFDFVIVTISDVEESYTPKSYAVAIFEDWGIGQAGKDNGLLLLNVTSGSNRGIFFEVGYGLEGVFTDSYTGTILDEMIPSLEESDYLNAYNLAITNVYDRALNYAEEYEHHDEEVEYNEFEPPIFLLSGLGAYLLTILFASIFGYRGLARVLINMPFQILRLAFLIFGRGGGFGGGGFGGSGGGFGGFGGGRSGGGGSGRSY